jgi:Domain of unknown function (DUF4332)
LFICNGDKAMPTPPSRSSHRLIVPNWRLQQLPGFSDRDCQLLAACGIETSQQLLRSSQNTAQQQTLAIRIRVRPLQLKKWVAIADLSRIPNVGCHFCGLLLHAGVGSVAQLSQMSASQLHRQLLRLHVATLQRQDLCPSVDEVAVWIQQARHLV